jgi:putative transposase
MILSYKYRIEPNQTQAAALDDMLRDFCQLYNAGLEQRIEAYRRQALVLLCRAISAAAP